MFKRNKPPPPSRALVRKSPAPLQAPEVLDGQLVPSTGPSADPFKVFLKSCDERSRSTMHARLNAAARILDAGSTAESYPWATLDHVAVIYVLAKLGANKASPSTRNLTRAALRKMSKVLFGLRLISVDERQRIDDVPPARGKRLPRGRALDARQLRKLFKACERDATAAGRRDAALVATMFGGGLRRDEASKLDLNDVDASAGNLRVHGKGDIDNDQPIVAEVVDALQAWVDARGVVRGEDAHALFVTIDKFGRIGDRRLDGKAIAWAIAKRAREAAIEPLPADKHGHSHVLSPHDLRRSFGTGLLDAGEDLATVAKAMRHASVATSAIYDRRGEKAVAAAVAKLVVPFGR